MISSLRRSMEVAESSVRMERSWSNPTKATFVSVWDASARPLLMRPKQVLETRPSQLVDVVWLAYLYTVIFPFSLALQCMARHRCWFRATVINGAGFSVDAAPYIGHPVPMLITLVILLEGCWLGLLRMVTLLKLNSTTLVPHAIFPINR